MTLMLAIVADDLTGALDTSAPFVAAGLSVAVAATHEATEAALDRKTDIVAINTASRAADPDEAARRVARVAEQLRPHAPSIVLKKIDSRLKGNVGAESAALAEGTGRGSMIVAPAVPDQARSTRDGAVVGRGVDVHLPVRPHFPKLRAEVRDAATDADLDAVVAEGHWSTTLAVGARGLGLAFARSLQMVDAAVPAPFAADGLTLFAFGSRDPITDRQVARLAEDHPDLALVEAPGGGFALRPSVSLPLAVVCTGEIGGDPTAVASRFADDVSKAVDRLRPSTLVMGGGDTALAILCALGIDVLFPQGEAAPGLPWFTIVPPHGGSMRCVVKSGGFGTVGVLSEFLAVQDGRRAGQQ